MKKAGRFHIGTGVSSLIMILVVLCLTVFGALSYTTARADAALTQKSLDATAVYYETAARMEQTIARADAALLKARQGDGSGYLQNAQRALDAIDGAQARLTGDTLTLTITHATGDGRTLRAVVTILPLGSVERYRIDAYQLLPAQDWNPDPDVQVWPGE